MTAQASFYPHAPPSPALFNFSALFGFRSHPQPSWRYEPPSLSGAPKSLDFPFQPSHSSPHAALTTDISPTSDQRHPAAEIAPLEAVASYTRIEPQAIKEPTGVEPLADRALSEPDALPKTANQELHKIVIDNLETRLARFGEWLTTASIESEERRQELLEEAIESLSPTDLSIRHQVSFTLRGLEFLKDKDWSACQMYAYLSNKHVRLPMLCTEQGLSFMQTLDGIFRESPELTSNVNRLQTKLLASLRPTPKGANAHTQDASLRIAMRLAWTFAFSRQQSTSVADLNCFTKHFSDAHFRVRLDTLLSAQTPVDYIVSLICDPRLTDKFRVEFLECVPRPLLLTWLDLVPAGIFLRKKLVDGRSTRSQNLDTWLKLLQELDGKATLGQGQVPLCVLASIRLAVHGTHSTTVSRLLGMQSPHALLNALIDHIPKNESLEGVSSRRVQDLIENFRTVLKHHAISNRNLGTLFARLISEMDSLGLPNHGIAELIVLVTYRARGLDSVLGFLRRLDERGTKLSDITFLDTFMKRTLAHIQLNARTRKRSEKYALAVHVFRQIRTTKLHPRLEDVLSKDLLDEEHARRQFQHIMNMAEQARGLPLSYRNMAELTMETRAELIHQLAHQYSLDNTRSFRQNYRAILHLYKYLKTNYLPFGPLFTSAAWQVVIVRPLAENRFVSSQDLTWVCKLVAKVEGVHAAKRLEHNFWHRRGALIKRALEAQKACRLDGPVHVSTVKRLGII